MMTLSRLSLCSRSAALLLTVSQVQKSYGRESYRVSVVDAKHGTCLECIACVMFLSNLLLSAVELLSPTYVQFSLPPLSASISGLFGIPHPFRHWVRLSLKHWAKLDRVPQFSVAHGAEKHSSKVLMLLVEAHRN